MAETTTTSPDNSSTNPALARILHEESRHFVGSRVAFVLSNLVLLLSNNYINSTMPAGKLKLFS